MANFIKQRKLQNDGISLDLSDKVIVSYRSAIWNGEKGAVDSEFIRIIKRYMTDYEG